MADEYLPPIKTDEQISNYNNPNQFMTGVVSVKNTKSKDDGTTDGDTPAEDTPVDRNEWRQDHIPYPKEVMIIGSFGTINNQREGHYIPKQSPPSSDGIHWTRKELEMIQELYRQDTQCHLTFVCYEYPNFECSKEYYLKKIMEFMKDCKQPGGMLLLFNS